MKKYLLVLLIPLLLIAGVFFAKLKPNTTPLPTPTAQAALKVQLIINSGEEPITIEKEFKEGQTAFSLLKETADQEKINLVTKEYDFGMFVQSLNNLESSEKMAWIYFVNGNSGSEAADKYQLKAGDVVEWKYIKPQF